MYVVIFRAEVNELGEEYLRVAARLRELALGEFGCEQFLAVSEANNEVTLSYWRSEESIRAWKQHAEHVLAQELGRERWYESYVVQIAEIGREYRWP